MPGQFQTLNSRQNKNATVCNNTDPFFKPQITTGIPGDNTADASTGVPSFFAPSFIQTKLSVNQPGDIYEREADAVADQVMSGTTVQRKCSECEKEEEKVQRKPLIDDITPVQRTHNPGTLDVDAGTETAIHQSQGGGEALPLDSRNYMESKFGADFSAVKIHTDANAVQLSQQLNARAFTSGKDIYFNEGQFSSSTNSGRHLLAHELTHVLQQKNASAIQRCTDPATDKAYDEKAKVVKSKEAYVKLKDKSLANKIIVDAKKKDDCIYFIDKLDFLFDTPEATAEKVTEQFQEATEVAVVEEQQRLADPIEKANEGAEEEVSAAVDPTKWKPMKGKFGGGTYYVDNSNPNNIVVKAQVLLVKKGTGTDKDVESIKSMEDAIEKSSSTFGYTVDVEFVNTVTKGITFTADVDPSQWETATNWSGGDPKGFAHELHHMFAFPLDRYNYIESHSGNTAMKIPKRLHWFSEELKKPANFNNPESLMASGEHPLDDDVCTVAGLDVGKCVATRQNTRAASDIRAKAFSLCFKVRNILSGILPASPFDKPDEVSENDLKKSQAETIATALFGKVSMEQVTDIIRDMQYRLTPGLLISLADAADKECADKETFTVNRTPPLNFCPQFFPMGEKEKIDIVLREAARMVKLSDRPSETLCATTECGKSCGGFNNADDWVKFIHCISAL